MCGKLELPCQVRQGFRDAAEDQITGLAQRIGEMAAAGLHSLSTFWIEPETNPVATETASGEWRVTAPAGFLQQHVLWLVIVLATLSVVVGALRMAWEQRAEPARDLAKSLFTLILVTGMGTATIQLLSSAADQFSVSLVNQALPRGTTFESALGNAVLGVAGYHPATHLPTMAAMTFALAAFVAAIVQCALMLVRSAMLVLLVGTFPLAAAATNTEVGRQWFKKYCGWTLAFIAYKPAAAVVYAAAMKTAEHGADDDRMISVLTGLMLMFLAVFALPALLRFAVPVTAAVAGGSGGGMGGGAADPGGLATGARPVGRAAGRPGGGGDASGGGLAGGGGSAGSASGAIGAATSLGAVAGVAGTAAGGAAAGTKKVGDLAAQATAHSAGESDSGIGSGPGSSGRAGGGGRGGRTGGSGRGGGGGGPKAPEPPGPSGSD